MNTQEFLMFGKAIKPLEDCFRARVAVLNSYLKPFYEPPEKDKALKPFSKPPEKEKVFTPLKELKRRFSTASRLEKVHLRKQIRNAETLLTFKKLGMK